MYKNTSDVIIIGSGIAGLALALCLDEKKSITIFSKKSYDDSSSYLAQGGIATNNATEESILNHTLDTLIAGADLAKKDTVFNILKNAKNTTDWLIEQGVEFDKTQDNNFHLTKEGGHSERRILHVKDCTGKAIVECLYKKAKAKKNIQFKEKFNIVDLLLKNNKIQGLYALNSKNNNIEVFNSQVVIIATGGASKVYQYTSNTDIATGDGIALAYRVGCDITNMEFNQFHPTCLYHPKAKHFLLSEALRGEGAYLVNANNKRFMHKYHPKKELAPRDIVARAIDFEMKASGHECVFLNISHKSSSEVINHFPTIYKKLLTLGIDITKDKIPVVPASHYTCGGVVVDENAKTNIDNLYAIGEVAYTGLHGANRLASNSLLECLIFARTAASKINKSVSKVENFFEKIPPWDESRVIPSDEKVIIRHNWHELRLLMWDYVSIVRTDKRLKRAQNRINLLKQEVYEYYADYKLTNDFLELRNLIVVAELVVKAAIKRKESRGLHYNLDYKKQNSKKILNIFNINYCKELLL